MKIQYPDGSSYTGDVRNQQRDGNGVYTTESIVYEGVFENDLFVSGSTVKQLDDGGIEVIQGTFIGNSVINCQMKVFHDDRPTLVFQGDLENYKFHNVGTLTTDQLSYSGGFQLGAFHGKGKLNKSDLMYDGEFQNGTYDGFGKLTKQDFTYAGTFKGGKFHGQGDYSCAQFKISGEFTKGEAVNGILVTEKQFDVIESLNFLITSDFPIICKYLQPIETLINKKIDFQETSWPIDFDYRKILLRNELFMLKKCSFELIEQKFEENQYSVQIKFANLITAKGIYSCSKLIDILNFILNKFRGEVTLADEQGKFNISQNYISGEIKDDITSLKFDERPNNVSLQCGEFELNINGENGVFFDNINQIKFAGQLLDKKPISGSIIYKNYEIRGNFPASNIYDIKIHQKQFRLENNTYTGDKTILHLIDFADFEFKFIKKLKIIIGAEHKNDVLQFPVTQLILKSLQQCQNESLMVMTVEQEEVTGQIVDLIPSGLCFTHNKAGIFKDGQLIVGLRRQCECFEVGCFQDGLLTKRGLRISQNAIEDGEFADSEMLTGTKRYLINKCSFTGTFSGGFPLGNGIFVSDMLRASGVFKTVQIGLTNIKQTKIDEQNAEQNLLGLSACTVIGEQELRAGSIVFKKLFLDAEAAVTSEFMIDNSHRLQPIGKVKILTNSISAVGEVVDGKLCDDIEIKSCDVIIIGNSHEKHFTGKVTWNQIELEGTFIDYQLTSGSIKSPNSYIEGEFKNYITTGKNTKITTPEYQFEGQIENGTKIFGQLVRNDGVKFIGNFLSDQPSVGILQYDENVYYEGQISDGLRHGNGKLIINNDDKAMKIEYEGEFVDDQFNGNGVLLITKDKKMEKFSGTFNNGELNDLNAEYQDGDIQFIGYILGTQLKNGQMKMKDCSFEGEFIDNRPHVGILTNNTGVVTGRFDKDLNLIEGDFTLKDGKIIIAGMNCNIVKVVRREKVTIELTRYGAEKITFEGDENISIGVLTTSDYRFEGTLKDKQLANGIMYFKFQNISFDGTFKENLPHKGRMTVNTDANFVFTNLHADYLSQFFENLQKFIGNQNLNYDLETDLMSPTITEIKISRNGIDMVYNHLKGLLTGTGQIISSKRTISTKIVNDSILIQQAAYTFKGQYLAQFIHGELILKAFNFTGEFLNNEPKSGRLVLHGMPLLASCQILTLKFGLSSISTAGDYAFDHAEVNQMCVLLPIVSNNKDIEISSTLVKYQNHHQVIELGFRYYNLSLVDESEQTPQSIKIVESGKQLIVSDAHLIYQSGSDVFYQCETHDELRTQQFKFCGCVKFEAFRFSEEIFDRGTVIYANGDEKEGDYVNGRLIRGRLKRQDGEYSGEFSPLEELVHGVYTRADGVVFEI